MLSHSHKLLLNKKGGFLFKNNLFGVLWGLGFGTEKALKQKLVLKQPLSLVWAEGATSYDAN